MSSHFNFVLDCSLTMTWLFEDEQTDFSINILEKLKTHKAIVPTIWALEVANVVLLSKEKKRISATKAVSFMDALSLLPIYFDDSTSTRAMHSVFTLAENLQLTIYDAAYLELAMREKIPLYSLDQDLIKAAHKTHVKINSF